MNVFAQFQARWQSVSRREQRWLLVALAVVLAALLWWVALAPALGTLTRVAQQRPVLETQLQQMLQLQAQAKALQAQPSLNGDDARQMLAASVQPLGASVQLTGTGEQVTVTLNGVTADALAQWLATARQNARAVPREARLVRNAGGTWDGSLILSLNAR